MVRLLKRLRQVWLDTALLVSVAACTATPIPDPPTLDPPPLDGIIHVDETIGTGEPMLGLTVPPGTLEPGSTLFVANLETAEPPLFLPVEADGSVTTTIFTLNLGDVLRTQVRQDDLRSTPVDGRVVEADAPLMSPDTTVADCLVATPTLELDFGAAAATAQEISFDNGCGGAVQLTPALRQEVAAFTVPGAPLDIADGGFATLSVGFAGGDGMTLVEDILLVEVTGVVTGRLAISLLGR